MVSQKMYFYFYLNATDLVYFMSRVDFHLFKLKGGVETFLVGCKRHHSVSFDRGLAFGLKPFTQNTRGERISFERITKLVLP